MVWPTLGSRKANEQNRISAVGDWMSMILLHMVWPQSEFRMQV